MEMVKWVRNSMKPRGRVMAAQFMLGDFEYGVLRAVRSLKDCAYGANIAKSLSDQLKRNVALAQVYIALQRLQEKGFVTSQFSASTPVRGGRARRVYSVEPRGLQALEITAAAIAAARFSSNTETESHETGRRAEGLTSTC